MTLINSLNSIPFLYHFTDRRNLPLIKKHGGLLPWSELERLEIDVPAPGGNEWSRDADELKGMGNYVHLCFRNNHPMEYVARQKGRIGDTLFLRVHSAVLEYDGVMFTNDVSNKNGVNAVSIQEAEKLIDFEVLYQKTNWKDPDIQERLQKVAKYEVLVPATIPLDLIGNLDG